MALWKISYDKKAAKQILKLSHENRQRVRDYMENVVANARNPYNLGKPLLFNKCGFWRYRIGKLRAIVDVQDDVFVVLVIQIDKRDKVYKKR